jgi:hypothetical protein
MVRRFARARNRQDLADRHDLDHPNDQIVTTAPQTLPTPHQIAPCRRLFYRLFTRKSEG